MALNGPLDELGIRELPLAVVEVPSLEGEGDWFLVGPVGVGKDQRGGQQRRREEALETHGCTAFR